MKQKRKKYLIDKKFQVKYIFYSVVILAIATITISAIVYLTTWLSVIKEFSDVKLHQDLTTIVRMREYEGVRTRTIVETIPILKEEAKMLSKHQLEIINRILIKTNARVFVIMVFLVLFIVVLGVFITHRIAGPLFRINRELDKLIEGDVDVNFIEPLLKHFSDSSVFSVSSVSLGRDNKKKKIPQKAIEVEWCCAGYTAYDKEKFLYLGGFHPIYFPFYCEDRDIGYRAKKIGWKNIIEPKSIVYHDGEITSKKLDKKYVEYIKFRNRCIFYLTCYDNSFLIFWSILKLFFNHFFAFKWHSFISLWWLIKNYDKIREKKDIKIW